MRTGSFSALWAVSQFFMPSDAARIKGATMSQMIPGEKLFYERCTLCHVPREPGDFTKSQWHGITQSMFPRAGLSDTERKLVLQFLEMNAKDAAVLP